MDKYPVGSGMIFLLDGARTVGTVVDNGSAPSRRLVETDDGELVEVLFRGAFTYLMADPAQMAARTRVLQAASCGAVKIRRASGLHLAGCPEGTDAWPATPSEVVLAYIEHAETVAAKKGPTGLCSCVVSAAAPALIQV